MKRWLLFVSFLILLLPFVAAANGCCAETVFGDTCIYTAEENCATPEYFSTTGCEEAAFCGTGCCVRSDGGCAEASGEYSCDVAGGVFFDGQGCDQISGCDLVCCQYGEEYSYGTAAECDALGEQLGVEVVPLTVSSEGECTALETGEENGCCVTQSPCTFESGTTCGESSYDSATGYGFYVGESCSDVSSYLADKGLEASAYCACTVEPDLNTCDVQGRIVEQDSCGNIGDVVEECESPDEACSTASGTAECVPADCSSGTFKFPDDSYFGNFNSYPVFYDAGQGQWFPTMLTLGEPRKNYESWCVYESPVGSFRDREGSQHYLASCVNGEEQIGNCASDRSEVCVTTYDPSTDRYRGQCVPNNFDSFYGLSAPSEWYGNLYYEGLEPVASGDQVSGGYGASTITRETDDFCVDQGSVTCDVLYGDTIGKDDKKGWEVYVNAYCLREEFSDIAADYCASRGKCGLKENIIGEAGSDDGLSIVYGSHFNDVDIGCGLDCFNPEDSSVPELSLQLQCLYPGGQCVQNDVPRIKDDYYATLQEVADGPTIAYNFLTEYLAPYPINDREKLLDESGAKYSECIQASQRLSSLLYGLGTDVYADNWYLIAEGGGPGKDFAGVKEDFADCVGENYCDENIPGVPFAQYGLFNAFRSVKPWYLDQTALQPPFEDKPDYFGPDVRYLTFYDGNTLGCGGDSEWQAALGPKSEKTAVVNVPVQFNCDTWKAPLGGDNCGLCDKTLDEGGLIFNKGDVVFPGSYCNKFRCESLGQDCTFVGENYGSGHPSCVSQPCEPFGAFAYLGPYEQALVDSGLTYTSSDMTEGYDVADIPDGKSFSFGLDTEHYARCAFVRDDNLESLTAAFGVTQVSEIQASTLSADDQAFFDTISAYAYAVTPVWGATASCDPATDENCVPSLDIHHNFTTSITGSEDEQTYYVWCQDSCGTTQLEPYQISLTSGFAPPTTPPTTVSVLPPSGSQVAATQTSQDVTISVDVESACKYSANAGDTFDTMTAEGTCIGPGGADSYLGYPQCSFSIPLATGTTTVYFLCKDVYGNVQTQPGQWYVSKTEALEITQTAPSGTQYTNEVVLQVNTAKGGENGNAACTYQEEGYAYPQPMSITGDTSHEQTLNRDSGDYVYTIGCTDSIGNSAEATIMFHVEKDISPPQVESVYYLGTTLYVITNEATNCQYAHTSFPYGAGTALAGTASTDHSLAIANVTEPYVISCIDGYGNVLEPLKIDFSYLIKVPS